jgi:hypothetical protein
MAKIESIDPHLHVLLASYRSLFHADVVQHELVGGVARCASLCPFEVIGQACLSLVTTNLSRQETLRMDGSIIEGIEEQTFFKFCPALWTQPCRKNVSDPPQLNTQTGWFEALCF